MPGKTTKFLLISNIFYNMWYAVHVIYPEYLQTDVEVETERERCLSEQCSHFSGLVKSSPIFLFTPFFILARF